MSILPGPTLPTTEACTSELCTGAMHALLETETNELVVQSGSPTLAGAECATCGDRRYIPLASVIQPT